MMKRFRRNSHNVGSWVVGSGRCAIEVDNCWELILDCSPTAEENLFRNLGGPIDGTMVTGVGSGSIFD